MGPCRGPSIVPRSDVERPLDRGVANDPSNDIRPDGPRSEHRGPSAFQGIVHLLWFRNRARVGASSLEVETAVEQRPKLSKSTPTRPTTPNHLTLRVAPAQLLPKSGGERARERFDAPYSPGVADEFAQRRMCAPQDVNQAMVRRDPCARKRHECTLPHTWSLTPFAYKSSSAVRMPQSACRACIATSVHPSSVV